MVKIKQQIDALKTKLNNTELTPDDQMKQLQEGMA